MLLYFMGFGHAIIKDNLIIDVSPYTSVYYTYVETPCGPDISNSIIFENNTIQTA